MTKSNVVFSSLNRRQAQGLFVAVAVTIYAAIFMISRNHQASLVSSAAMVDLTVTTGVVFYFLLVRPGHAGWMSLVTVALLGLRTATFLFPAVPVSVKWLAAPLELLVIASVVHQIRRMPNGDALTRIRTATGHFISNARLARVVAAELSVFYYALCSWRSHPDHGFSCERSSGYSLFGTLLIFGMVFEGIPLHLLVMHYSQPVAWTLTALDIYGLIWALAILRANRLRTTQVDDDSIHVRAGLIWEMEIPLRDVVKVRPFLSTDRADLKAVFLNTPKLFIQLDRPVRAMGLYGNTRMVTKLALAVDSPDEFIAAVCDSLSNV